MLSFYFGDTPFKYYALLTYGSDMNRVTLYGDRTLCL